MEFDVAFPVEKPPAEVQDVAFEEDQVRSDEPPVAMVVGLAENETVGTAPPLQELELCDQVPLLQA